MQCQIAVIITFKTSSAICLLYKLKTIKDTALNLEFNNSYSDHMKQKQKM